MFAVDCSSLLAVTRPGRSPDTSALQSRERVIGYVGTRTAKDTRPLFSYSYRLLLPQAICFYIHTDCPGGDPPSRSFADHRNISTVCSADCALFALREKEQHAYFLTLPHSSRRSSRRSCASAQQSTPLFSCAPALFVKSTREGVLPRPAERLAQSVTVCRS
jgi:hypothetical protein